MKLYQRLGIFLLLMGLAALLWTVLPGEVGAGRSVPLSLPGRITGLPATPKSTLACVELLEDRSFEQPLAETPWLYDLSSGVIRSSTGEHSGNFALFAPTFDGTFYAPAFSQKIRLPEGLVSDTITIDLSFYKRILSRMNNLDDRAADKFYAVISTESTPGSGTQLTNPMVALDGSSLVGINQIEPIAILITKRFTVTSGIDLDDYAGEEVYLHLYNTSNQTLGTCPNSMYPGGRCATEFYFDDMSLIGCGNSKIFLPVIVSPAEENG